MITDEEVLDLFGRADPARAGDPPPRADAAQYLDALIAKGSDVTLTEISPKPYAPGTHHRWLLTAAAIVLVVLAASITALIVRDDTPPARRPPVQTPVPLEVAKVFFAEYATYDIDAAASHLANETTAVSGLFNPQDWRLGDRFIEAIGVKFTAYTCHEETSTALGAMVSCDFEYGGPFVVGGPLVGCCAGSIDLTVSHGAIVATAISPPLLQTDFPTGLWEQFATWMRANYPHQIELLYTDAGMSHPRITEQSVPIWEKRVREYLPPVSRGG